MSEQKTLTMEEYSRLFEHIILAEYDNLFQHAELRQDLGLADAATAPFLVEYLSVALYLLEDVVPDSRLPEAACSAVNCDRSLLKYLRSSTFSSAITIRNF